MVNGLVSSVYAEHGGKVGQSTRYTQVPGTAIQLIGLVDSLRVLQYRVSLAIPVAVCSVVLIALHPPPTVPSSAGVLGLGVLVLFHTLPNAC